MVLNSKFHKISSKFLLVLFPLLMALSVGTEHAFANTSTTTTNSTDPIGSRLCAVITVLTGNTAKAITVVAIIVTGGGFFVGKVQWPVVMMVMVGVITVFSAPSIANMVSGNNDTTCVKMQGQ